MGVPACRLADMAFCQKDEHGCPGCPHTTTGPAISGSPNTFANGRPALRVGDAGMHAHCCGPNTWVAVKGSKTVYVNGRPWVGFGDPTQHCIGKKDKEEEPEECEAPEAPETPAEAGPADALHPANVPEATPEAAEKPEKPEKEEEEEEGGPGGGQGKMVSGSPNVFVPGSMAEVMLNWGLEELEEVFMSAVVEPIAPALDTLKKYTDLSPYQPEITLPEKKDDSGGGDSGGGGGGGGKQKKKNNQDNGQNGNG